MEQLRVTALLGQLPAYPTGANLFAQITLNYFNPISLIFFHLFFSLHPNFNMEIILIIIYNKKFPAKLHVHRVTQDWYP